MFIHFQLVIHLQMMDSSIAHLTLLEHYLNTVQETKKNKNTTHMNKLNKFKICIYAHSLYKWTNGTAVVGTDVVLLAVQPHISGPGKAGRDCWRLINIDISSINLSHPLVILPIHPFTGSPLFLVQKTPRNGASGAPLMATSCAA